MGSLSRFAILALGLCVGPLAHFASAQAAPAKRPNVMFVLADDLGYSDLGCFGSEIHTPNLDALAKGGVRFTGIFNDARCCPSRASLMTGLYPHEAGMGGMSEKTDVEGYLGHIRLDAPTIAEVLKANGYHTALFGKWHLANTLQRPDHLKDLNRQTFPDVFCPIEQYPTRRGFETYWGALWGLVDYYNPFSLVDGETPVKEVPDNFYMTDAINDRAAAYIKQTAADGKPFFMYLANNAPHWPLHALPEDIAKYQGKFTEGYDAERQARYKRMVEMGLVDPKTAELPKTLGQGWDKLSPEEKKWRSALFQAHAAMIDRLDQGLGKVFAALKETGQWDNTIIFFLSDNGASPEEAYGPGFDRPSIARDGKPIIHKTDDLTLLAGGEHTFFYIGRNWANVANTPYRKAKASQYNGGERTGMIVHWPAGLKVANGSILTERGHIIDLMPTALDIAGVKLPDTFAGKTPHAMQGVSLLPLLQGEKKLSNYPVMYGEHEGGRSVLTPDGFKAIRDRDEKEWHLYDLNTDQTEIHDLAKDQSDRVAKMVAMWDVWAKANNVLPKP
ncbi:MAG: sulfatase [Phycisphaerales bacterium]|nr:sulfatase [Phycisphaerales bacterium]